MTGSQFTVSTCALLLIRQWGGKHCSHRRTELTWQLPFIFSSVWKYDRCKYCYSISVHFSSVHSVISGVYAATNTVRTRNSAIAEGPRDASCQLKS